MALSKRDLHNNYLFLNNSVIFKNYPRKLLLLKSEKNML